MRYFEKFPMVWHAIGLNEQVLLPNLTRRVMIVSKIRDIEGVLLPYRIHEGETPRTFAQRVYGSFELFWVVLLINKIVDQMEEWPKPESRVVEELTAMYGLDMMWDTRHYVNEYGVETDPGAIRIDYDLVGMSDEDVAANYGLTPVSYHDDAIAKNEAKRSIYVLDPDYINLFVDQLEQEMKNA